MKTKICNKCCIEKNIAEFTFRNDNNRYRNTCTLCRSNNNIKYYDKFPWKKTFISIKERCNNSKSTTYKKYGERGIKCLITEEELKELWYRDNAFLLKRPSIDRINNDGNYCIENCRFIELSENCKKDKFKSVLQFDLNGNFIKEWSSFNQIQSEKFPNLSNISQCCVGKIKTAYKFIWKYKEESK